jgi:polysaccharide pyruvyl transferase
MPFSFFATPSTLEKLYDRSRTQVVLAGGFNGYWNFGDVLQLQGTIRWHRSRQPDAVVTPVLELGCLRDERMLQQLRDILGAEDIVLQAQDASGATVQRARELGLVPLVPSSLQSASVVHVHGGGFFNQLWGHYMLRLVEAVLRTWLPRHYVLSGQQISPDFVNEFAAHAQQWQPSLIGCRDALGVKALGDLGLDARLSGDDALEEMSRAAECSWSVAGSSGERSFALHMNLSGYVYGKAEGGAELDRAPVKLMNEQLELLRERFGSETTPVVINAFNDERPEVQDSVASLKRTDFSRLFPQSCLVDVAGALMRGQLTQAAARIRGCELLVASSYHATLFGKVLGIPTFLGAFNEYYRQKKAGLAESAGSLREFLDGDLQRVAEEQAHYIARQRELRREWHESFASLLSEPGSDTRWMVCANGWLADTRRELEERRTRQRELEIETASLRERCSAQEARLAEQEARLAEQEVRLAEQERERARQEEQHRVQEGRLVAQSEELAELRARHEALVSAEPPLRHAVVDALNNRLKGGGRLLHGGIKRVAGATVSRRK